MIANLKPYAEYKDSGLPWLGQVPGHWDVRRAKLLLREVDTRSTLGKEQLLRVSQYTGVTQRKTADGSDSPDTRASSLVGYKRVMPSDLVINIMLAWNGSMGVSRYDGIASPAYCVYRFKPGAMPWYYHELLRLPLYKGRIKTASTGVVESRLRLYSDDLGRIEVVQPPPAEQAAIVRFLDWANGRMERAIRAKRKVIALLGEQKQAIIHRAVTRGLDPSVPLKPSGIPWLGDIPQHWECTAVWQLFEIGRGKVTSHQYIGDHPGPYPLYSSQTENEGVMGRIDSYMFDGDYLTWTTDGAHAGTVFRRSGQFSCTNVCGTLRSKGRLDLDFMRMSIASETKCHVRVDINPKLMNNMMARIRVVVPPYDEQVEIAKYVEQTLSPSERAISRLNREIELLREYRTRLVADVVTGKLDVREAAAQLPDDAPLETIEADANLNPDADAADEEAAG